MQGQRLARDAQHRVRRLGRHVREELGFKLEARADCGRGRLSIAAAKPPFLGFGLGLRPQHYAEILAGSPAIDRFKIIFAASYLKDWVDMENPARVVYEVEAAPATLLGAGNSESLRPASQ